MRYIACNNENNGYAYNVQDIFSWGRKFFHRGEALRSLAGLVSGHQMIRCAEMTL